MKKYTFDLGDRELEVEAESLNGAWDSVNQYDFATLTHIDGVRVGYPLKEKES